MSNNRDMLFDVLNNDFTNETKGLSKKARVEAVEDYFARKSLDGTVSFAFVDGDCVDTRLRNRQTYRSMIEESQENVQVNVGCGQRINLTDIFSKNAMRSYMHWLKGDRSQNLDSSCIVYATENGEPKAILGVIEGYYTKNDFGVKFHTICLPETDYFKPYIIEREKVKFFDNEDEKPKKDSYLNVLENFEDLNINNKTNDKEIDLPEIEKGTPQILLLEETEDDDLIL